MLTTIFRQYLPQFSIEIDSPEIFGLHPNADLTFRVKEVTALFATLGETQPKGGGGGGDGPSREDIVSEKAADILSKMPEAYIEEEYKVKINKLGETIIATTPFVHYIHQYTPGQHTSTHNLTTSFFLLMCFLFR